MSMRRKNRIDLTCDLGGFILGTAIGVFINTYSPKVVRLSKSFFQS